LCIQDLQLSITITNSSSTRLAHIFTTRGAQVPRQAPAHTAAAALPTGGIGKTIAWSSYDYSVGISFTLHGIPPARAQMTRVLAVVGYGQMGWATMSLDGTFYYLTTWSTKCPSTDSTPIAAVTPTHVQTIGQDWLLGTARGATRRLVQQTFGPFQTIRSAG
jgi:hypothetical protein